MKKKGNRSMLIKNINDNLDDGSNVVVLQSSIFDITYISFPYSLIITLINGINLYNTNQFSKLSEQLLVSSEWSIYGMYRSIGGGEFVFIPTPLGRGDPPLYTSVDDKYFLLIKGDGFIKNLISNNNFRAFYTKWSVEDFISDFDLPNTIQMRRILHMWNPLNWPNE